MRSTRLIIILITALLITGCSVSNYGLSNNLNSKIEKQLSQKEKLEDFEYMYKILNENYSFFEVNKRVNGVDWLGKKNVYISMIKRTENN